MKLFYTLIVYFVYEYIIFLQAKKGFCLPIVTGICLNIFLIVYEIKISVRNG